MLILLVLWWRLWARLLLLLWTCNWMKLGGGQLSMPGSMIIYKFEENVTSRAQICGCGGHRAINNVDVMHRFEYRKLTRHQQATITHSLISLFCLTGAPARNKACKLMMITFTMSVQTWAVFFFADHWSRTTECVSRSESRYRKAKNIKRENNNKLKKILIMTWWRGELDRGCEVFKLRLALFCA